MSLTIGQIIERLEPKDSLGIEDDILLKEIKQLSYHPQKLDSETAFVLFKEQDIPTDVSLVLCKHIQSHFSGPQLALGDQLKTGSEDLSLQLHKTAWEPCKFLSVTGTNGKSTVVHLCREMASTLDSASHPSSLGTLGIFCDDQSHSRANTTLLPLDLHNTIQDLIQQGSQLFFLEASSHGIAENRLQGIPFHAVAFTSFGQDHLDYHQDLEQYLETKLKLATLTQGTVVVNADEASFASLLHHPRHFSYSLINPKADLYFHIVETTTTGFMGNLHYKGLEYPRFIPIWGRHNLENLLAATGLILSLGHSIEQILDSWNNIDLPKGRLEKVETRALGEVRIDYAHTPDALKSILKTAREHLPQAHIRVLFGCGGDRDRSKRPIMGAIAEDLADQVILSSDNPRNENPNDIISQILSGTKQSQKILCEENRTKAIQNALQSQTSSDILLLCGKGHESEQIIGTQRLKMDEFEICKKY